MNEVERWVEERVRAENERIESDVHRALVLQDAAYLDRLHIVARPEIPEAVASYAHDEARRLLDDYQRENGLITEDELRALEDLWE